MPGTRTKRRQQDIRATIRRRLDKLGASHGALAKCRGLTSSRVYEYLAGSADATGRNIGRMLQILGGRIVWDDDPGTVAKVRRGLGVDSRKRDLTRRNGSA